MVNLDRHFWNSLLIGAGIGLVLAIIILSVFLNYELITHYNLTIEEIAKIILER